MGKIQHGVQRERVSLWKLEIIDLHVHLHTQSIYLDESIGEELKSTPARRGTAFIFKASVWLCVRLTDKLS